MAEDKTISPNNTNISPSFLGGLTASEFLSQYWQKKHLFIANAFPDLAQFISANELAGFSLEEQIESRIIVEKPGDNWELKQGPFNENTFAELPESHWTLLVQAVDHYVPSLAELLDQFNFLPQWRIDDIMMSYAATGGNVGPHYDYYDVFLIQISGQRHWKVGQVCNDNSPLKENLPVRILKNFTTVDEWTVNPGDVLYIPPGVAHHGVALDDDCITLSVGFRAPSYADMIGEYSHFLADNLAGHLRYHDDDLSPCSRSDNISGTIREQDFKRVKNQLLNELSNDSLLTRWMAEYLSLPKYDQSEPMECDISAEEIMRLIEQGAELRRDEASRYICYDNNGETSLFINGNEYQTPGINSKLIALVASNRVIPANKLIPYLADDNPQRWIISLIQSGWLYFQDNEE
ncbi:MAG: cupin domain-containing protein [Pseudomonadales bacterium]|nr:cupin domain-containing protein [Pseudomonadales bacterium]